MVVMERDEYIRKDRGIIEPTNLQDHLLLILQPNKKNKLITLLKNIKTDGGINDATYIRMYPHRGRIPQNLWVTKN